MSHLRLFVLLIFLLPLLLEGCLVNTQYFPNPRIRSGAHVDIWNFSDNKISADEVDQLYLMVAHLMSIITDNSLPHPQVLLVSPSYIRQMYLRFCPSVTTQKGIAIALYIPSKDRILIPYFDRTLLTHELSHYFAFHYPSAPRYKWEEIADKIVDNSDDYAVKTLMPAALFLP